MVFDDLTGGIDYFPGPFTVVFLAGETIASFYLLIADDEVAEPTEFFFVKLDSESSHYLLKSYGTYPYHCVIYIQDDDCKFL